MTIALPIYRGLSTKFAGRTFQVVTRRGYNPWLARVDHTNDSSFQQSQSQNQSSSRSVRYLVSRGYATTARPRTAGRPKATATQTPGTKSKKPAAKKPGPKTAAGKKKVGRKPKAKPKAKKAAKPLAKKAKKPPSKRALNRARVDHEKDLKEKALLNEPKLLPASPWQILFAEAHANSRGVSLAENNNATKEAAHKLRNLTSEDKEHYNHEAHLAKEKNVQAHNKWLGQFTPEQIKDANNARLQLKRIDAEKRPNRKHRASRYSPLKDDRLVKRPLTAYNYFTKERFASGDFSRMVVPECSKLIGREWKALTDKKPYTDQADADLNRYIEEYKSVYGGEPNTRKSGRPRKST